MQAIDIFNNKVSVFKGVHASTPAGTKSIGLLVDNEKFADRVEAVRNEKNTSKKKKNLSCKKLMFKVKYCLS